MDSIVGIFATGISLFAFWGLYRSFTGFPVEIICNAKTIQIPYSNKKKKSSKYSNFQTTSAISDISIPDSPPSISLHDYVKLTCPSLLSKFYPTFWLPEGNVQTAWCSIADLERLFDVKYKREILKLPDNGTISIDWAIMEDVVFEDTTPTVVLLHGLTGGSHESYIQDLITTIQQTRKEIRIAVLNYRGCANTELTSPKLYCAAYTGDVDVAVQYIKDKYPLAPLIAVGYSLGSNILVKYLGEKKEESPFLAAVSICNPFDLLTGTNLMHKSFIGRNVYSRKLASNLKRYFVRVAHMFDDDTINVDEVLSSQTIREFDNHATRKLFGYPTVNHYYRDGSSWQYIHELTTPLLCIQSLDDPVAMKELIPYDECRLNPHVILATTGGGGHIGWLYGLIPGRRWVSKPITEFVCAMFEVCTPLIKLNPSCTDEFEGVLK